MSIPVELIAAIIALITVVIGGMLANKDKQQQATIDRQQALIDTLFNKHDELWQRVDAHKLYIAENHYRKPELDAKFERLEGFLRSGIDLIGQKIDRLGVSVRSHDNQG